MAWIEIQSREIDLHNCELVPLKTIRHVGPGSMYQCEICKHVWIVKSFLGWRYYSKVDKNG